MIAGCNYQKDQNKEPKTASIDTVDQNKNKSKGKFTIFTDTVSKLKIKDLILKYNPLTNIDTIEYLYSFQYKNLIRHYSNIIGLEAELIDLDQNSNKNIVILNPYLLNGICRFNCNEELFQKICKEAVNKDSFVPGYYIVKITKVITPNTDLVLETSEIDPYLPTDEIEIVDYIKIDFSTTISPYYIFYGEIIDLYLI